MTDMPKDPRVAEYIEGMRAWRSEFEALRPVLLRAGLDEEFKWRKPCYTHDGSNVVIFQPFKDLCALLFFKGALLEDPDGALKEQGKNTRSALRLEFRSVADVTAAEDTISDLAKGRHPRRAGRPLSPQTRSHRRRPLSRRAHQPARRGPRPARRLGPPHPRPPPRLATPLQRRQAVQDPHRPHRARNAADLGRLRNARLTVT